VIKSKVIITYYNNLVFEAMIVWTENVLCNHNKMYVNIIKCVY